MFFFILVRVFSQKQYFSSLYHINDIVVGINNSQLESRLHRMDRRAAMKRKRSDVYDEEAVTEKSAQSAKLVTSKR